MVSTMEMLQRTWSLHTAAPDNTPAPIVIVGNGPVGMRVAKEVLSKLPDTSIVIYGEEQQEPYNRVQLSSWLAGDVDWSSLSQPLHIDDKSIIIQRFGYKVIAINVDSKSIHDSSGYIQPYSKLILATGSTPHRPNIPGLNQAGVYTFRNYKDANSLIARRARSHHTVVIGGGLLGIESARAMQKSNTRVTIVEHGDRLLRSQLDTESSELLKQQVLNLGIELITGDSVSKVVGRDRVEGIQLRYGKTIQCDTIILSTGILPNIELAKNAKLAFSRGIIVNDSMQTSNKEIYAVGECAEHRNKIYGLVAPGLEQASVAAAHLVGIDHSYSGSVAAARLKIIDTQVFSMGPMGDDAVQHLGNHHVYRNKSNGEYRKILIHRHRLIGAIGIGEWHETVRLQTTIGNAARIYPWQILRFLKTGNIWPEETGRTIDHWPAGAIVCQCMGVTRGALSQCIAQGACNQQQISAQTGASSVCGSCKPLVQQLLGSNTSTEPVSQQKPLLALAGISLFLSVAFFVAPSIPYATSVQSEWHWDSLWRNSLLKQISGFSILGLFSIGLLLSIRKQSRKLDRAGSFDLWRIFHIVVGTLVIFTMVAHTGFRLGDGLNFLLMLSFVLMLFVGSLSTGIITLEHRLGNALGTRLRRLSVLSHILLFWPVPVLLGWHIFKGYWY